ncbi:DnaD domain-containing protein [Lentilactobacillus sp. SPB1-3]|uniref:DnaD domain-containing protein n=1 Tax=Lentilactobacillus terminaliae TaxID=3003483 RepID=A0ACD5DC05_9LACO|nr:DnaD domain protein [Lentilactobacillus sp. SPB1-3]MCZ0977221.1 DnaD domain protein [Lentilactobacillus sp. SPB1-3]
MTDNNPNNLFKGATSVNNLLLINYPKLGVSNDELLIYVLIKRDNELVIPMPDADKLAAQTGFSKDKIYQLFHSLIEHKNALITTVTRGNDRVDAYDFSPMYQKLLSLINQQVSIDDEVAVESSRPVADDNGRSELFTTIEKEFGRTLSPIEMETISGWLDIDRYPVEIITLALKEAVLNQVYNLKYMDRIMLNWDKLNLKSVTQIQNYLNNRETGNDNRHNDQDYNGPEIPFIDLNK